MPIERYLDAIITYEGASASANGVSVLIPLPDGASETPTVLHNPMPGLAGTWHRETANGERPARYLRVDNDPR